LLYNEFRIRNLLGWVQWLMSVITATLGGRDWLDRGSKLAQEKVSEILCQPKSHVWWYEPVIPAMWKRR
jgi:hypothetical protein